MKELGKKFKMVRTIPEEYKYEYIDEGVSGKCYRTEDGSQVFKELINKGLDKQLMKHFTYIKSDSVAFPRTIIYKDELKDENIIGYLCDYVAGTSFDKLSDKTSIDDIINASDILEKELKRLAEQGIQIYDMKEAHTFFTPNKRIVLTDTDLYSYSLEEPIDLYKGNIKEWGLFTLLYFKTSYPYKSEKLNELFLRLVYNGKVKPSIILEHMLKEMRKASGSNIKTIGEFKEGQQLIKKLK